MGLPQGNPYLKAKLGRFLISGEPGKLLGGAI